MIISIASGKGGTGKTLVATSLALAINGGNGTQLVDCDVEEPNANIFMKPVITGTIKSLWQCITHTLEEEKR